MSLTGSVRWRRGVMRSARCARHRPRRVLPIVPPGPDRRDHPQYGRTMMNGYVAKRRGRFYAVIYEGLDPVTGRERRRWHPAATDREQAQRLAIRLAAEEQGRADAVRTLTLGAYLTSQWLPAKKLQLAAGTYRGYERNVSATSCRRSDASACAGSAPPHRSAVRPAPHPEPRATSPRTQDRLRDPRRHPRRPRRRRPARSHPQRRPRRPLPQTEGDPTNREPVLDRRPAPPVPAPRRRSPTASRCCGSRR